MRFEAFYGVQLLGELLSLFTCGAVLVALGSIGASQSLLCIPLEPLCWQHLTSL